MADSLDGTVALVTGASSGIGRASARRLAAAGASVAVVARRGERLEALAEELRTAGSRVDVIEADLTDAEASASAVERAVTELGRLDTVVNAAGLMLNGPTVDLTLDDWDRMIDIKGVSILMPRVLVGANDKGSGLVG